VIGNELSDSLSSRAIHEQPWLRGIDGVTAIPDLEGVGSLDDWTTSPDPSTSQSSFRHNAGSPDFCDSAASTASSWAPSRALSARSSVSDAGTALIASMSAAFFSPPAELSAALPKFPPCFRCPINQEIMTDPVFAVDGITYERENIVAYFSSGRRTSPVTGSELPSLALVPNVALKEAIVSYAELHSGAEHLQKEWSNYLARQGQKTTQKLLHRQRQVRALRSALEQSSRRIQCLEAKGSGPKTTCLSPNQPTVMESISQEQEQVPSDGAPAVEPMFKCGPAPRTERPTKAPTERRKKVACPGFLFPGAPAAKAGA